MKGIYLASYKALHNKYNIIYQDINGKRDIDGDMMDVSLEEYDFIIATPPCNYYSKANYRRDRSEYALKTRHLLPDILKKLSNQDKPFIVENVQNKSLIPHDWDNILKVFYFGGHAFWTNIDMDVKDLTPIKQKSKMLHGQKDKVEIMFA